MSSDNAEAGATAHGDTVAIPTDVTTVELPARPTAVVLEEKKQELNARLHPASMDDVDDEHKKMGLPDSAMVQQGSIWMQTKVLIWKNYLIKVCFILGFWVQFSLNFALFFVSRKESKL
jgi:hypothetical protein